jgi:hypothetical protein
VNINIAFNILYLVLALAGCDRAGKDGETRIILHLKFPQAMSPSGKRFQEFLKRANYLEVKLKTKEGVSKTEKYSPDTWSNLQILGLDFPQRPNDELSIEVTVWDKSLENSPRNFPAFRGGNKLKAEQLSNNRSAEVWIKLAQQISPHDY